jgi:hypothetical protein
MPAPFPFPLPAPTPSPGPKTPPIPFWWAPPVPNTER